MFTTHVSTMKAGWGFTGVDPRVTTPFPSSSGLGLPARSLRSGGGNISADFSSQPPSPCMFPQPVHGLRYTGQSLLEESPVLKVKFTSLPFFSR